MTPQARIDMDMLSFYIAVNKMREAQKQKANADTITIDEMARVRVLEETVDGMISAFNNHLGTKEPYPAEGLFGEFIKNIP